MRLASHVFVLFFVQITHAWALETCELFDVSYAPIGYSQVYRQVAVKVVWKFCVEGEKEGSQQDYELEFVDVYTESGALKRRFAWAFKGTSLEKLSRVTGYPKLAEAYLRGEVLPREKIDAHLKEGKFTPVPESKKSPNGLCQLETKKVQHEDWVDLVEYDYVLAGKKTRALGKIETQGKLKFSTYWYQSPYVLVHQKETELPAPGMGDIFSTESIQFLRVSVGDKCW